MNNNITKSNAIKLIVAPLWVNFSKHPGQPRPGRNVQVGGERGEGHNVFHNSFPDLSLESGTIFKILYFTFWKCGKLFSNELDVEEK